ncbi:MAG: hypothetical protein KAI16_01465 [Candidatus Pacebacteria bacterium]|nr:hypothetical protein [Candidatus Paceibacterota bacterium]
MSATNKTMVHLRMNSGLHKDVKKIAEAMGVSVSLIGETLFKDFLNTKKIIISDPYIPNDDLKKVLDEASKNRDNSKYWFPNDSVSGLMTDLKK